MTAFYKSETYLIVKAMKATGNQTGVVEQWRRQAEIWAATNADPDAAALKAWLPLWQVRPFYTAAELAPMWPALGVLLGITARPSAMKSANRLSNELDFARLPMIGTYYTTTTVKAQKYYVVERCHYWREQGLTQRDFEKFMWEFSNGQH